MMAHVAPYSTVMNTMQMQIKRSGLKVAVAGLQVQLNKLESVTRGSQIKTWRTAELRKACTPKCVNS